MDDLRPSFAALTGLLGPAASTNVNMVRKVPPRHVVGEAPSPERPLSLTAPGVPLGACGGLPLSETEHMSHIHEALKKAQEERHSGPAADTVTLSVETPRTQVIGGIGLGARAANAWARTETVPAPPR